MTEIGRYWVFTENTHAEALMPTLEIEGLPPGVTYICGQLEKGEHFHLQGYVEIVRRQRVSWLKKNLSPTAHFKLRRGTQKEAIHYCKKPVEGCECKHCVEERENPTAFEGTFREIGLKTADSQGRRTDIHDVTKALEAGTTLEDVISMYPEVYIKYHAGIEKLAKRLFAPDCPIKYTDFKLEKQVLDKCLLIYGSTGLGKTEYALSHFERPLKVNHLDMLLAYTPTKFDGIVFDDMCFRHLPPPARIALTENDRPADIHIRYTTVRLPAHTKKIFTHNDEFVFWGEDTMLSKDPMTPTQKRSIERRVNFLLIKAPLFERDARQEALQAPRWEEWPLLQSAGRIGGDPCELDDPQ